MELKENTVEWTNANMQHYIRRNVYNIILPIHSTQILRVYANANNGGGLNETAITSWANLTLEINAITLEKSEYEMNAQYFILCL